MNDHERTGIEDCTPTTSITPTNAIIIADLTETITTPFCNVCSYLAGLDQQYTGIIDTTARAAIS